MLGLIFRLIVVAFLARLVLAVVSAVLPRRAARPQGTVGARKGGMLVRDPVCGTYVEPSHAVSAGHGDDARYFCSEQCRRAFLERAPAG